MYLIYVLIDPRDRLPFYVGMTCRPRKRWGQHHSNPSSAAYPRLRELRAAGLKPRVRIMREGLCREVARIAEAYYIDRHLITVSNAEPAVHLRDQYAPIPANVMVASEADLRAEKKARGE